MDQMINIFENEEFGSVRTMKEENGSVVFCGSDVAKALGYRSPKDAISAHCKLESSALLTDVFLIGSQHGYRLGDDNNS